MKSTRKILAFNDITRRPTALNLNSELLQKVTNAKSKDYRINFSFGHSSSGTLLKKLVLKCILETLQTK